MGVVRLSRIRSSLLGEERLPNDRMAQTGCMQEVSSLTLQQDNSKIWERFFTSVPRRADSPLRCLALQRKRLTFLQEIGLQVPVYKWGSPSLWVSLRTGICSLIPRKHGSRRNRIKSSRRRMS